MDPHLERERLAFEQEKWQAEMQERQRREELEQRRREEEMRLQRDMLLQNDEERRFKKKLN